MMGNWRIISSTILPLVMAGEYSSLSIIFKFSPTLAGVFVLVGWFIVDLAVLRMINALGRPVVCREQSVDCSFRHTRRLAHPSCQRLKWRQDWGEAGIQYRPGNVSDLACIQAPAADSAEVTLSHFSALLKAWIQREKDIFEQGWIRSRSRLHLWSVI